MSPAGPKIRPNIRVMCKCLQGSTCSMCSTENGETISGNNLANIVLDSMSKLNKLTKEVSYLQQYLQVSSERLQEMEISSNESCEGERRNGARRSRNRGEKARKSKKAKGKKSKFNSNYQCEMISSEDELGLSAVKRCEFKHSALGNFQRQSKCLQDSSGSKCRRQ